jgi:DNA-binding response OmpR family regulator
LTDEAGSLCVTIFRGEVVKYRHALVVDDDPSSNEMISDALGRTGFEVSTASRGRTALAHLDKIQPDLVVLELSLPDIDGLEVCRRVRSASDCYVVFASERQDEIDLLLGLEAGADDFLGKPISARELQARVAAMFRRPRSSTSSLRPVQALEEGRIDGGDGLVLDRHGRDVEVHGQHVELTRTEFDLLTALATRPGVVVPRRQLLREVWDTEHATDTHLVDVHVANVRRKLREHGETRWIRTVRGVGFRFDAA